SLDQLFHSKILVKFSPEKADHVNTRVSEVFARSNERRNEIGQVTLVRTVPVLDETAAAMIDNDRTVRTINAQLVEPFYLRRKTVKRTGAGLVPDQNAQLIDNFLFAQFAEKRALIADNSDFSKIVVEKLCELCDAVAEQVVQ